MTLRRICALTTVLTLAVTCAMTASAQQGRGGAGRFGGGRGGMAMLLRMKPVQDEVKLSADQREKVTKIADDAMEAMRDSFSNLRDASPEERREAMEKFAKQSGETDKKITEILKPEQAARVKELSLQLRGVGALSDPEVATALKLTDDQKTKLADMAAANRPASGQRGGGGAGASDEDRAARAKARAEREAKTLEVLTADQREQFSKMQGKKFEFPAPQGRPGAGTGAGGERRRATA